MLQLVETHFDLHATIWESNILISDAKTALSAKTEQIMAALVQQRDNSVGVTLDKAALRKDLEEKALSISTAICAYTIVNPGHKELYKTAYITKTTLVKMMEVELLYYVECLCDAAMPVLENLAPYGITEATLSGLMDARNGFYEMMRVPGEITSNRKEATEAISVLLHQAIAILDDSMDRLVKVLSNSAPEFVNSYFNERRIHKAGTRTMSLEITTVNAADNSPLAGAKIEVVDHRIKRKSSISGKNKVQNLKEGYYTLSVTHTDFVPQTIPFTIISGQRTEIVAKLQRPKGSEEVVESQSRKGSEDLSFSES